MTHLVTIARCTGAAYLGLAAAGMVGHLVLTTQLTAPGDPAETLTRLHESPALAHLMIVMELLVVLTQALAAWGFFALFRRDHLVAAFGVAAFGMANALAILVSAVFLATAVAVSADASSPPARMPRPPSACSPRSAQPHGRPEPSSSGSGSSRWVSSR
ncbi:DUF4386 domain-containing protein [Homoserinibacter gongjuensis]|uniref:DUF4386 domain-containing protein n=1 Tax=Homoserinibacter gongjuensis TaxID=1162968 RepID=A0ABQ6JNR7_9MICO|nr:DUF4386 domain-containing protein [Homoserinibacter gongjuensis]GMA89921.1 hypothetical protein GCM10025869_04500 [Homoserinibacter gongjuensis]